jgi:predicted RNase H-like HicB family nuclease
MRNFEIVATWDDEAQVWVAESPDVPGLATEAATREELVDKLKVMIPELLEANASLRPAAPEYVVHWHQETRLRVSA